MSHTAIPDAQIEAVVETENIGEIVVTVYADSERIYGENEEAIENDAVEDNAREYLLTEFDEVVTIEDVL